MLGLNCLKHRFLYMVLAAAMVAAPYADGELLAGRKMDRLRIIYDGGLTGKIEPCG